MRFGERVLDFPSDELGRLRESNELLGEPGAMRDRMDSDGYLLLRRLVDRETVLRARRAVLEHLANSKALAPGRPIDAGHIAHGGTTVDLGGFDGISHDPVVLALLESPTLQEFFAAYFDEPALTLSYKWLRAVGSNESTGVHCDVVYMGRGSQRLHTVWIPFGDISIEQGCLAIHAGSHNSPALEHVRRTYGRVDVDRDLQHGWFTTNPMEMTERYGGTWQTSDFQAGDVLIFGMFTMHASTANTTTRYRLSCDVRFQPASDPIDERWGGDHPVGYIAGRPGVPLKPLDQARAEWGV